MAHLIFIAKNRDLASFQLTGPAVLGRSVECDIFTPDVFVSRQHCRFEKGEGGWAVIDQRSRNGVFYNGKRVYRRILKHNDLIEIGSFSVRFDQGDIPGNLSTMTPFGEGTQVASLMDTLYSGGLRPAEYLKQSKRKPAWVRAKEEAEAAAKRAAEEAAALVRAAAEKLNFSDGAELDIELQINMAAQEIQPQFVLVSRDLLARFNDLLDEGRTGALANRSMSVDVASESMVAAPAGRVGAGAEAARAGAKMAATIGGANSRPLGPQGPTGAVKGLWDEVYAEVEGGGKKGDKGKKTPPKKVDFSKKEDPEEKAADAKEAKEKKKKKKKSEYRAPIGEQIKDWYEWAKTVDASVNGIVNSAREYPKQWGIAAAAVLISCGTWIYLANRRPTFHPPDLSHYTDAQRKAMLKNDDSSG